MYPILVSKRKALLKCKDLENSKEKLVFTTLGEDSVHPYPFNSAPITAKELMETIDFVFISFCADYS